MSVTTTSSTTSFTSTERTWRATIETPAANATAGYYVSIHREMTYVDAAGAQLGTPVALPAIVLPFTQIAAETVTIDGVTLTVAQLSAFLSAYFDQKATAVEAERAAAAVASSAPPPAPTPTVVPAQAAPVASAPTLSPVDAATPSAASGVAASSSQ